MINIKCFFPRKYYLLRKVSIKIDGQKEGGVGHGETLALPLKGENKEIKFRLDYHRAKICPKSTDGEVYLILYFEFREKFPFCFIDLMFKNLLRARQVGKAEFEAFGEDFYSSASSDRPMVIDKKKALALSAWLLLSLWFSILPFYKTNMEEDIKGFTLFSGLLGLVEFFLMVVLRKKPSERQYGTRAMAFGAMTSILVAYLDIALGIKIMAMALSLGIVWSAISPPFWR